MEHTHEAASRGAVALLLLGALCLPSSCEETPTSATSDEDRTLATLTKVEDYPLYTMRFFGDYHFDDYLKTGFPSSNERAASEADSAWWCTTFSALNEAGEYLLGRNFDWYHHMALLLYTDPPDGYSSASMVDLSYLRFDPGDASRTNLEKLLGAPYYPFDGMNERGLAIGMMAVPHAEGGHDASKVTIGSLDAIRLMLDYAATVEEAVALLGQYNIDFTGGPPVHYLISDSGRRSAILEFIDGEISVIRSDTLWQVSTNFIITGYPFSGSSSECWRYNRAFETLKDKNGLMTPSEAMGLLQSVSQGFTMWSVVYCGVSGEIRVAVGRDYENIHVFEMPALKLR